MGWWKADPGSEPQAPQAAQQPSSQSSMALHHPQLSADSASACPVDPKTREIWLQQAQQVKKSQLQGGETHPQTHPQTQRQTQSSYLPASHPLLPNPTTISSQECSSDRISQDHSLGTQSAYQTPRPLSHGRVVSSIPRAFPQSTQAPPSLTPTTTTTSMNTGISGRIDTNINIPANAESETGASESGNWIYPSEHQFFHAVMRKQQTMSSPSSASSSTNPTALAASVSAIIPIHNAVNEQAWVLIKRWEKGTSDACGGPKLLSFQGLGAGARSPKARWNAFWGYTEPFDRHDWVVQRCDGTKVEYVIDFYQGKAPREGQNGKQGNNALNFYLDVRPKLNTMEGWRMRAEQLFGWR
ncbi:uncharacterized protein Z519_03934 [Cladophialophora bantiana CBS 173.52]|uniref:Holocytochrome c-type synthase n=1 Tax=Cladophialophora bantiana (strain ATCC 10958 / CBS 173.52 / CDC B-1940 / NIH 8579) TaxID=1442370 RepID=A0A0D2HWN8_CLAB1|nr:uncharacterized protein Z519_03934 [Cladophialophora bantiana CBS 173.52]KIW95350.1 hypothetical protein Z519_03934 [Cladophialophora bantiana CBS 173.52]